MSKPDPKSLLIEAFVFAAWIAFLLYWVLGLPPAAAAQAPTASPVPKKDMMNFTDSFDTAGLAVPREPGDPSDPSGPTGRLCQWLHCLQPVNVPQAVCERAKHLLLDGIGCAIVGAQLPWSRTAAHTVRTVEGTGERTVIGWDWKTSTPGAALLNGSFIQGFELDDFHPRAPLHSAALVLPALLACAEHLGEVTGERFVLGAIAGFEVGPRVGLALNGIEMLSRGWHAGAVFGTHAAAAAAGVLLELDGSQFEDALGLAATQSAGLMAAQYEAMCKRMHHGLSARNGLYSALLAAGGYTGIKRVFERPYGGFLATNRWRCGSGNAGRRWKSWSSPMPPWVACTTRWTRCLTCWRSAPSAPTRWSVSTWKCRTPPTTTAGGKRSGH
jgi:hypothetical protein